MLRKIIQNGLPSLALLLHRILRFSIEHCAHSYTVCTGHKFDGSVALTTKQQIRVF
jgi:hypothetical protein